MPDRRPTKWQRTFTSQCVDATVEYLQPRLKDSNLGQLFANALPNTLDTTVFSHSASRNTTFIITGDITASWLRDTANQLQPYLRWAAHDAPLAGLLHGAIKQQAAAICQDPYANSFNMDITDPRYIPSPHTDDDTSSPSFAGSRIAAMTAAVFERKYELDSTANFLRLSAGFYAATGDLSPFDNLSWKAAALQVLNLMLKQQESLGEELADAEDPYQFQRQSTQPTESLWSGVGYPRRRTGLIRTGFRPSDDAATFPLNIPQNALAVVALREVAPLLAAVGEAEVATEAMKLAAEVDAAIWSAGVLVRPFTQQTQYAYEVDGYGSALMMDDANVPSLLSLPYLGYVTEQSVGGNGSGADWKVYQRTRQAVLNSETNPWFFNGSAAEGVGSPHTGWGRVWHMAMITRAMTSTDDAEIAAALDMLSSTTACQGLMHESLSTSDPGDFSRPWFAWANSYFAELVMRTAAERPHLVLSNPNEPLAWPCGF